MKITGIATQGRQDAVQWVTAYYIYYGYDGVLFSKVRYWWNYAVKVRKLVDFISSILLVSLFLTSYVKFV